MTAKKGNHSSTDLWKIEMIHDKWLDVKNRQMWIHGVPTDPQYDDEEPGVEHNMSTKVIKNLHILKSMGKTPVTIHLHTCGGDCTEGMAIYDAIKMMPYKTRIISYTHARSMSSIILQAGDYRYLLPHSYFMFHEGTSATWGTVKSVNSWVEFSKIWDQFMMDIYARRLQKKGKFRGKSQEKIKVILRSYMDRKEDVYLTAEEAVKWGFADKVLRSF